MNGKLIIDLVALGFIIWFIYSRFAGVKGLRNVSSDQLQEVMDGRDDGGGNGKNKFILIDVREPGEVKQGFIPGAVNIPVTTMSRRVGEIPKDRQVYLYCRSGMRSKQAARILRKQGFKEISHLRGGIMSWKGKLTQ
ncbi:sulfurtransferase [Paenibacillus pectinilyticus]|uniref:Sulfurtransferase n=1 Tax=Paenibacillus pectinilyticus TaxID=512399 RepID=A0A1C1A8B2_9BACL|nr:rhodanese-like domain-containing protein [Paenibacillus pectinilyticus]OCT16843.1 sulfurtransferase [Paenibacillus pectinilyticus]